MESSVDLGFLEPCEEWLLANKFFRSKVGGKPAWLELENLPAVKDLLCGECGEPCVFLCQVSFWAIFWFCRVNGSVLEVLYMTSRGCLLF